MKRLQGPINPCFLGEHLDVECLEQGFVYTGSLRFEDEQQQLSIPSLQEKMSFLQMLQSVESPSLFPFKEPNFRTLLKLQHLKKPWDTNSYVPETETQRQALELESCVTHDLVEWHSPVKSETRNLQNPHSNSCLEGVSSEPNQEKPNSVEPAACRECDSGSSLLWTRPQTGTNRTQFKSSPIVHRERRKRKRTRPTKNKEEIENQRMNHIAVERNRRRQMNDHLNSLRSLMPASYVQRGDQASIIGGAIDFVKELEQLLQSLEAEKRVRKTEAAVEMGISSNGLFSPQCTILREDGSCGEEAKVRKKLESAEIEVTAIQNHVNLKIQCERRPGQLLRAIVALDNLRVTVLHLNITSSQTTVLYSFNLKVEDDCKLGSTDEVAAAVHQIFSITSGS